jgi:DNA polymerase III delta prime subunit
MSEITRTRRSTRISKSARPNYNLLDLSDKQLPPHLNSNFSPTKPVRRPKRAGRIISSEKTSPTEQNTEPLQSTEVAQIEIEETFVINDDNLPKSPIFNKTEAIEVEYCSELQISEPAQNTELVSGLRFEESEDETPSQEPLTQISDNEPNEVIVIKSSDEIILDKADFALKQSIQHTLPEQKRVHPFFGNSSVNGPNEITIINSSEEAILDKVDLTLEEPIQPILPILPEQKHIHPFFANISHNNPNETIVIKSSDEIILDKVDLTLEETIQSPPSNQKPIHPFFAQFKPSPKKSNSENIKPKTQESPTASPSKSSMPTHPFFFSPQKKKEMAEKEKLGKAREDESKRLELIKGMNRGKVLNPFFNPTTRPKSASPRPSTPSGNNSQVILMDPLLPLKDHHMAHTPNQTIDLIEYPPLTCRTMNAIQISANFNFNSPAKTSTKPPIVKEIFSMPEMPEWWDDIIAPINQLPSLPTSNQGTWSTKYIPNYSEELQQNFESIRLLETWLKRWKIKKSLTDIDDEYDQAYIYSSVEVNEDFEDDDFHSGGYRKKSKRKTKKNGSRKKSKILAGFPESDNVPHYWTSLENVMIIEGPPRSGKTSLVHACARSMDYQVVELHPGMLRSSKGVQQIIGEISQTHFVGGNGKSNVLIFINHVDLLFPNDNNFWQTLNQIAKDSKRPIVLTSDPNLVIPLEFKLNYQDKLKLELMELEIIICQIQYIAIRDGILLSKSDLLKVCNLLGRDFSKILNQLESNCKLIKDRNEKESNSVNFDIKEACLKMDLDFDTIESINLEYEGPMINYTYINNIHDIIKNDLISYNNIRDENAGNLLDSNLDLDQYLDIFESNSNYDILKPSESINYEIYEPETCLRSHSLPHRIEEFDSCSRSNSSSTNHCIYQNYVSSSSDFMKNTWGASTLSTHYEIINGILHSLESLESLQPTPSIVDVKTIRQKVSRGYTFKDTPTRMSNSNWWQSFGSYLEPIITDQCSFKFFGRGMRRSQLQYIDLKLSADEELVLKSISPSYPKECENSN